MYLEEEEEEEERKKERKIGINTLKVPGSRAFKMEIFMMIYVCSTVFMYCIYNNWTKIERTIKLVV